MAVNSVLVEAHSASLCTTFLAKFTNPYVLSTKYYSTTLQFTCDCSSPSSIIFIHDGTNESTEFIKNKVVKCTEVVVFGDASILEYCLENGFAFVDESEGFAGVISVLECVEWKDMETINQYSERDRLDDLEYGEDEFNEADLQDFEDALNAINAFKQGSLSSERRLEVIERILHLTL